MDKQKRNATTFYTSFDNATARKLQAMARARRQSDAELIRAAVLEHMKRIENTDAAADQRELALAEQLKKSTNRICALLAKTAIDINLVARYIWETADDDGQELFEDCHVKAIRRVRQRTTPVEQEIADAVARE